MTDSTTIAIRSAALAGREAAGVLTETLRRLEVANQGEPLPAGFVDHREDFKSARATIERVCGDMERLTERKAPQP